MIVHYLADLAQLAGTSQDEYPVKPTILDLLKDLARQYGSPLDDYFLNDQDDDVSDSIFILLNGRHICHLNGVQTQLKESDEISLIPIMEAG